MSNFIKTAVVLIGLASLAANLLQKVPPSEAQQIHFSASTPPVKAKSCVDCHEKICKEFESSPITRTQTPGNDPEMLKRYVGREFHYEDRDIHAKFIKKDGDLYLESNAYPKPMKVDYIFGSGTHAQTPMSIFRMPNGETTSFTHQISWYPNDTVDLTLGMEDYHGGIGRKGLGEFLDATQTRNCFSCHSTHFPVENNRLVFDKIEHNVSCERCHQHGDKHIYEAENGIPFSQPSLKKQTPLESIRTCGECHRRDDQLTAEEIDPTRDELIRFAPVGISQSQCFLKQGENPKRDRRLDCMTCHDPHQTASRDPLFYSEKCTQCHGRKADQFKVCTSEEMTLNCIKCHMPTLRVQKNLAFTDHWIRVFTKKELERAVNE